jgi:hypothetical protein
MALLRRAANLPVNDASALTRRGAKPLVVLRIQSLSVDAADPRALATFWEAALGWRRTFEDDDEVVLEPPDDGTAGGAAADLLFLAVRDERVVKNRLHLDLRPEDQAAEVARLEALGARRVDIGQGPDVTWVVLADPEGNEFCVLRALRPDEVATGAS